MSFATLAKRLKREHGHIAGGAVEVTIAADFLHGGEPTFARVFDRRGSLLCAVQRVRDEPWEAFKTRARVEAGKTTGALSLLIGGLPDGSDDNDTPWVGLPSDELPRALVTLPEAALHPFSRCTKS